MNDINQILDGIEERANAATPGPWGLNWGSVPANGITTEVCRVPHGEDFLAVKWTCDRDFIAASRTDVPALVKALRRALTEVLVHVRRVDNNKAFQREIAAILSSNTDETI